MVTEVCLYLSECGVCGGICVEVGMYACVCMWGIVCVCVRARVCVRMCEGCECVCVWGGGGVLARVYTCVCACCMFVVRMCLSVCVQARVYVCACVRVSLRRKSKITRSLSFNFLQLFLACEAENKFLKGFIFSRGGQEF